MYCKTALVQNPVIHGYVWVRGIIVEKVGIQTKKWSKHIRYGKMYACGVTFAFVITSPVSGPSGGIRSHQPRSIPTWDPYATLARFLPRMHRTLFPADYLVEKWLARDPFPDWFDVSGSLPLVSETLARALPTATTRFLPNLSNFRFRQLLFLQPVGISLPAIAPYFAVRIYTYEIHLDFHSDFSVCMSCKDLRDCTKPLIRRDSVLTIFTVF